MAWTHESTKVHWFPDLTQSSAPRWRTLWQRRFWRRHRSDVSPGHLSARRFQWLGDSWKGGQQQGYHNPWLVGWLVGWLVIGWLDARLGWTIAIDKMILNMTKKWTSELWPRALREWRAFTACNHTFWTTRISSALLLGTKDSRMIAVTVTLKRRGYEDKSLSQETQVQDYRFENCAAAKDIINHWLPLQINIKH